MPTPFSALQAEGRFSVKGRTVTGDDVALAVRAISDAQLRAEVEHALRYDTIETLSPRALKAVKERVFASLAYGQ